MVRLCRRGKQIPRLIPEAGHMGRVPGQPNHEVLEIVTRWIKQKLA